MIYSFYINLLISIRRECLPRIMLLLEGVRACSWRIILKKNLVFSVDMYFIP